MSEYKKLYEIEGFDKGVKVRHKDWNENCYMYFYVTYEGITYNHGVWLDKYNQIIIDVYRKYFNKPVWEVYKEPRQKKRFWIWSLKNKSGGWEKTRAYLSEGGEYTNGESYSCCWYSSEKIKHENEYIDVEMDND